MADQAPSTPVAPTNLDAGNLDAGSLDAGNYEVLRQRLLGLGRELGAKAEALNARRKALFGGAELSVVGTARVRTENNCLPRDIVAVQGQHLLVGYNVFVGLKTGTRVSDVLSLQRLERTGAGELELQPLPESALPALLDDPTFKREFAELFQYYKDARLDHVVAQDQKLLAVFRTGKSQKDVRVFRWSLDGQGQPRYTDNRGERDYTYPPSHDFTWTVTSREDHVRGRHPHVSLQDLVFVETVGGDLTVKVEDNTEDGLGIYREPVEDKNQALDDANIQYAVLGSLVVFKVLPFRETEWRHFVFNTRTRQVLRVDAIARACVQLPEDHGIIFPGGYYLQTGAHKLFDGDHQDLEFKSVVRSPNGEDVLYAFHRREAGSYVLFPYNLIRKEVQTPIHCHGWTLFADGTMLVFRAQTSEPTRVHPLQVWKTPFCSAEVAAAAPTDGSLLARIGNADLVRGISEALSLQRLIEEQRPTRQLYEDLIASATRTVDAYHWLGQAEAGDLLGSLQAIRANADLIVDEFEKVLALRGRAEQAVAEAELALRELERELDPSLWSSVDPYLHALSQLRTQRGHLISLRELRYVELPRVEALEATVVGHFERVSRAALEFFLRPDAFGPLVGGLERLLARIEAAARSHELAPLTGELETTSGGLEVLAEVLGGLEVDDPTTRTRVLEVISEALSHVNRVRATLLARRKELRGREGQAEFAAQFRLFAQAVSSALALSDKPERCDEQLARLMLQLEELEGKFGEFDQFLSDLTGKRSEVYEAFDARRQALVDERQRRAQTLLQAADRIAQGIGRKAATLKSLDELHAYFAADPMVGKLRQIATQLLALQDTVKSDEVLGRLKAAQQDALRALRDRLDLGGDGEGLVRLGRHSFHVHSRPFELTLVPAGDGLELHLTGTDFHERLDDPAFADTRPFWDQQLVSETAEVYRGEYLAASLLFEAEAGRAGLSLARLSEARADGGLLELVRACSAERYDEGYERGVHDADAALILAALLDLRQGAGLLRFPPAPRAWATLFWCAVREQPQAATWLRRAGSLHRLRRTLGAGAGLAALGAELGRAVGELLTAHGLPAAPGEAAQAGLYLVEELGQDALRFASGAEAGELVEAFRLHLDGAAQRAAFEADLAQLGDRLAERWALAHDWLTGFLHSLPEAERAARAVALPEAVALLLVGDRLDRAPSSARLGARVSGLLGQHPRIVDRALEVRLDELLPRLSAFRAQRVPAYRAYRQRVRELLERERARLRLDELRPRVLTSFVRNRLVDEVYLPLVGDNLAKQIGAAGAGKRTDLMGLLLLISPPGYGKTTLMEYVASRLGLAFVKVNGPALGHAVTSLDPAGAGNATARQELEKIGLALEMGNNVMLYLDDIQHTSPELLQKFISLCDGSRRIEGVWRGRTRTYDLRGKKFCVVMAGNPYTESGERFQIPDMLANRADTYNLGDVLAGKEELFALSYLENALTSNPTLAPLAARDPADVQRLVRMARGEEVPSSELSHSYAAVELQEIQAVLRHLLRVQEVLLQVNQQYIASAAQADEYRTEPPFKLQGSYRNMNKVAEKVAPALNADELERLIDDHYQAEAQTLTTGAEQSLLKLAELRGRLTPERRARWEEIKRGFQRLQLVGGSDADPVTRVTGQLSGLTEHVRQLRDGLGEDARALRHELTGGLARLIDEGQRGPDLSGLVPLLERLVEPRPDGLERLVSQQAELMDQAVRPLAEAAARSVSEGHAATARLAALLERWLEAEQARRVRLRTPANGANGTSDVLTDAALAASESTTPPPHSSAEGPLPHKLARRRGGE